MKITIYALAIAAVLMGTNASPAVVTTKPTVNSTISRTSKTTSHSHKRLPPPLSVHPEDVAHTGSGFVIPLPLPTGVKPLISLPPIPRKTKTLHSQSHKLTGSKTHTAIHGTPPSQRPESSKTTTPVHTRTQTHNSHRPHHPHHSHHSSHSHHTTDHPHHTADHSHHTTDHFHHTHSKLAKPTGTHTTLKTSAKADEGKRFVADAVVDGLEDVADACRVEDDTLNAEDKDESKHCDRNGCTACVHICGGAGNFECVYFKCLTSACLGRDLSGIVPGVSSSSNKPFAGAQAMPTRGLRSRVYGIKYTV